VERHLAAGVAVGARPTGDGEDGVGRVVGRPLDRDLPVGQDEGPGALPGLAIGGANAASLVLAGSDPVRLVVDRVAKSEVIADRVAAGAGGDDADRPRAR
jgi:hypothetical protein